MRIQMRLLCGVLWLSASAVGCGSSSGSNPGDAGSSDATTEYAPYFYTWGWGSPSYAFSSLVEMKAQGGPAAVTLAFVLSDGGCSTSTDIQAHRDDIQAYLAAGGHVKASFGGATGTYLESVCTSAGALTTVLEQFVDDTGITDLDFDLEQGARSSNATLNSMRAAALKQLQDERHARVAFTLPIAPGGLLQDSLDIVQAAVSAGVRVSLVNGMTMDYGNGTDLGTTPIQSIDSLARQLRGLMPDLGADEAYRHVGAIAMIGKNDDEETFSLDNAGTFIAYARQKQLGLVSFWAIQRDRPCPSGNAVELCSRVNTAAFQFSALFAGVNGSR
jgi:Glycosyl hydrolases family 18